MKNKIQQESIIIQFIVKYIKESDFFQSNPIDELESKDSISEFYENLANELFEGMKMMNSNVLFLVCNELDGYEHKIKGFMNQYLEKLNDNEKLKFYMLYNHYKYDKSTHNKIKLYKEQEKNVSNNEKLLHKFIKRDLLSRFEKELKVYRGNSLKVWFKKKGRAIKKWNENAGKYKKVDIVE